MGDRSCDAPKSKKLKRAIARHASNTARSVSPRTNTAYKSLPISLLIGCSQRIKQKYRAQFKQL
ncbi:hypothetical protein [Microcoleus sp. bin38.metabat.b11b12b14.051]|uniref:hypothetical protein n=1 Tax=Microcoleus sp. bin38.metabat.b11b12b14.051 TaxID=2742709 RepID=UPI0025F19362|nr:hypothetical protein [Microcoleus sp. bin38.metabat.b11b12b14.051]